MPNKPSGDIRRRWELRVLIALPAVWVLLASVEAYLTIDLTLSAIGYVPRPGVNTFAVERVRLLAIGGGGLIALAIGMAFAVAVTRPIKDLLHKIQHRLHGDAAVHLAATSDLRELSNAFDSVLLSVDKFVTDSNIIDGMPIGILVVDKDNMVVRANEEAHRLLRKKPPELVGLRSSEICAPEMWPRLNEALAAVRDAGTSTDISGEILFGERSRRTSDSRTLAEPNQVVTLQPTMIVGEVVVAIRDLSQLATIRGQIQRIDQLAALGAHVASLAHEISGGLMGIQVLIDLLPPHKAEGVDLHAKLREEVERAVRLLAEIRSFGQASVRERTLCNLARIIEETLWMLDIRFMEKEIRVVKRLNANLPQIHVDRDRVIQAILNVVTNAFEATPSGGTVTVAMDRVAEATLVRISNSGSFIPPEERRRIFTMFYTTKRSGTGFGLPMARRAMLDHGGDIEVNSSPEAGTEFVLAFPDDPSILGVPPQFEARQVRSATLAR